jgi:hypothetical protein
MGLEAICMVQFGSQESEGKALLETDYIYFKGDFKIKAELKSIRSIKAAEGVLHVQMPEGTLKLELGDAAEKWLQQIRNPKSLLEKLGVKNGMTVLISRMTNEEFIRDLKNQVQLTETKAGKYFDLIFLQTDQKSGLKDVKEISKKLQKNGALWIVYPKGKKEITQNDVLAAGKDAKLVDVKVVGFSDTHTALKFVIPVANRK